MEYKDRKINYTNFLRDKPLETDPGKSDAMEKAAAQAMADLGIFYGLDFVCYADGRVKVSVYGKYFNMFDTNAGKFFSGFVGD